MNKFHKITILLVFLTSCRNNPNHNKEDLAAASSTKTGQTLLTTSFKPAFLEHSTIIFTRDALSKNLSILINCNSRIKAGTDTFYFQTKQLTQKDIDFFDTTLIRMIHIPLVPHKGKIVDGIGISFNLVQGEDSLSIDFQSPYKTDNPLGYIITKKAINGFNNIFNDEIVSQYFDDINTYLEDSPRLDVSKERPINKLRQKKYGSQH